MKKKTTTAPVVCSKEGKRKKCGNWKKKRNEKDSTGENSLQKKINFCDFLFFLFFHTTVKTFEDFSKSCDSEQKIKKIYVEGIQKLKFDELGLLGGLPSFSSTTG